MSTDLFGALSALFRQAHDEGREVTVAEYVDCFRPKHLDERYQVERRMSRYTYAFGPMFWLGQQIVRAMQDAGYPAEIYQCFRSPEEQQRLYAQGRTEPGKIVTKALPFTSAHQFYQAVDIIHPERGWNVSTEYWETLAACVRIVAKRYGVELDHGHYWRFVDSAHIELRDWRDWRERLKQEHGSHLAPGFRDLWERFQEVLPGVAKQYASRGGRPVAALDEVRAEMTADDLRALGIR